MYVSMFVSVVIALRFALHAVSRRVRLCLYLRFLNSVSVSVPVILLLDVCLDVRLSVFLGVRLVLRVDTSHASTFLFKKIVSAFGSVLLQYFVLCLRISI